MYASVGPELIQYDFDVRSAVLTRRGSVTLPTAVQYALDFAAVTQYLSE